MDKKLRNSQENETIEMKSEEKKYYSVPTVIELGLMQKLTLGGSQLDQDSGQGPGTGPNV